MEEIWKPIPNTNNKYHASNLGRIKSSKTIIKGNLNRKNGYWSTWVCGKKKKHIGG